MTAPALWQRYAWRGREVIVVQQWRDPFGRPMICVASAEPGEEEMTAGMAETEFLAEARALPPEAGTGERMPAPE